ncbi:MAG: DNA repair protein RadA [Oscillospiraceae bacterium]|nr:DNA repair protein RadA [Oscillospiraceae bacterium]
MARIKEYFICNECGAMSGTWYGKCTSCGSWDSLEKHVDVKTSVKSSASKNLYTGKNKPLSISNIKILNEERKTTGIKELDRVLGGGIVSGSVILIGGNPGIGKSTLLLQICRDISPENKILYISGEENGSQIKIRSKRLGVGGENVFVVSETDINAIEGIIEDISPDLIIVDSIQTMNISTISSFSGSVTQVRESTNILTTIAKKNNICIIIVGHVNKDGGIAGPKVLEHLVDVVLHFEGDKSSLYRIIRGIKNRYGSTDEVGIFQMTNIGLIEVENPSKILLEGIPQNVSGSSVSCIMEGVRPILVEIQALVTKTSFGTPRRDTSGFDYNRMSLLIAIIEKRGGFFLGNLDVYLNIVGGIKINDPVCDLAVVLSIISSLKDFCIPSTTMIIGEVGLSGEIRTVNNIRNRIREAINIGFDMCIIPNISDFDKSEFNIKIHAVDNIKSAINILNSI